MRVLKAPGSVSAIADPLQSIRSLAGGLMIGRRHHSLQSEGHTTDRMLLLENGWIVGSMLLAGGARQIVSLYLPGDLIGAENLVDAVVIETLTPVVDVTYRAVPLEPAREAVARDSALSSALLRDSLAAASAAKKQLTSIGRTPASARIAGLLVHVAIRLGYSPDSGGCQFECLLNQEQIGDYTGLTAVHVNRMLMRLAEDGLIIRSKSAITIPDLASLARVSELHYA